MTLWEKIKDFFFNGDTQKCLFILNELCHPPADITKRDIKIYFEQLQGMANCGDRLHFTQVNDLMFTLTDKDFKPVLSLNLQKASYTVQAVYQEDADYAYEKTFPLHTPRALQKPRRKPVTKTKRTPCSTSRKARASPQPNRPHTAYVLRRDARRLSRPRNLSSRCRILCYARSIRGKRLSHLTYAAILTCSVKARFPRP